jgi:hypothetical protein
LNRSRADAHLRIAASRADAAATVILRSGIPGFVDFEIRVIPGFS